MYDNFVAELSCTVLIKPCARCHRQEIQQQPAGAASNRQGLPATGVLVCTVDWVFNARPCRGFAPDCQGIVSMVNVILQSRMIREGPYCRRQVSIDLEFFAAGERK